MFPSLINHLSVSLSSKGVTLKPHHIVVPIDTIHNILYNLPRHFVTPLGGGVIPPACMQIREKTADKIIDNLLNLLEEKDKQIANLNAVISELADESLSKSVEICKLLEGKEVNNG